LLRGQSFVDGGLSRGSATSRRIPGAGLFRALQLTKRQLDNERGAKLAQIEVARRLTYAIWHILTNNEPSDAAPRGAGRSEPKSSNGGSVSLVVSPTLLGRPPSWVSL
jgi:hypothetical protein